MYAMIVMNVAGSSIRIVSAKMMKVEFSLELEDEEVWVVREAESAARLAKSSRS